MPPRLIVTIVLAAAFALLAHLHAAELPTGTIAGRIFQSATGANLERARLTVDGTLLEAFTDADGRFMLSRVPIGPARLRVFYTGLAPTVQPVTIEAGRTALIEISLSSLARSADTGAPVKLDAFVVGDSREMSGTAIAINEQRFAPNLRSVVSTDEFGDVPDGNVAEFIKFLPGVSVNSARELSINGVPSAYVPVSINGFSVASPIGSGGDGGTGRSNSMDVFTTSNISRIEVSFSPTPDTEGAALAGSVNMVPRSAFERPRPSVTASTFVSLLNNGRDLRQPAAFQKYFPGLDVSVVAPLSKVWGFTLSGGYSTRMTDTPVIQNVWRGANTATNGAAYPATTPDAPYLSGHVVQTNGRETTRSSLAASVDWKLGAHDRLSFGLQYSTFAVMLDNAALTFDAVRVLPGQFSITHTRGAAGAGTLQVVTTRSLRINWTYLPSLTWRHDGRVWKADAGLGLSRSRNRTRSVEGGLFGTATMRRTGVTVSLLDAGVWRPREITVTDGTTGAPVDPFSIASYAVTAAVGSLRATDDTRHSAYANARREFTGTVPLVLKAGLDMRNARRDGRGFTDNYTFLGRDGVASSAPGAGDDGAEAFVRGDFGERRPVNGFPRVPGLSNASLYERLQANPAQFGAPNANARYRSLVGLSNVADELISSAYLRADLSLLQNRLKLVTGLRAEQTNIAAAGPLTDPARNFQRDARGEVILGANRRPLLIATDALEVSKLTYLDRGTNAEKEYLRLFPSLNASYTLRDDLVARAAVYPSVGRPDFSQYSGGITLPDPEALPSPANRIAVNNVGIKAWNARTVSARLEYYFAGVGQLSAGAFRREIENFFGNTVFRATPEFLALYGLDADTYGDFDVATQYNLPGTVRMEGITVNYKQALTFLPAWARGVQVFGNLSVQRALGDTNANFAGYVPKTGSWGASLTRERVTVHVNWNYRGRARRGLVATGNGIEPSTYNWGATRLVTDVIAEYHFTRRLTFFANLRNLYHVSDELEISGPTTPAVARLRQSAADFGSLWTMGVKGKF